jgi:dipeptidyl aminopeptidase/acylaminoacyl peptidase
VSRATEDPACVLGIAALSASPLYAKAAPKAPVPLEEYFKIRRVGSRSGILLSFSHDEQLVAYLSDEGGPHREWADDGKTFLYQSSLRDEKFLDLYEYDVATGKSERLWEASGSLTVAANSRDHQRFVLSETLTDQNANLYLFDRGSKEKPVLLTPHQGEVLFNAADLSPDGKTLYYTSDGGRELQALYAMDLSTRENKPTAQPEWDVEEAGFTHAGKYFFYGVNADGSPPPLLPPNLPPRSISSASPI